MTRTTLRRLAALTTCAVVAAAGALSLPGASADNARAVLPENASDVGVYTDGLTDSLDIDQPVYSNLDTAQFLEPGVPFTADSMHQRIFDKDLAAGGTSFYLDRVLGVRGNLGSPVLQTRGRTLYMRGAERAGFDTMGFAGAAHVGGPDNLGDLYTVTVPGQVVSEVPSERFNAPSHFASDYRIGSTGVVADLTKFITYDNVALTAMTFRNPGDSPATFTVRAASRLTTEPGAESDELTGTRVIGSGANNGLRDTPWDTVDISIRAAGFTRTDDNLERTITVAAGGSTSLTVTGVVSSDTLPRSVESHRTYAALEPAVAIRTGLTEFNRRWAQDIPYIDVPDPAVEKAIVYRWWGERYNSIDANASGHVYQYPTTVEGSNLYQNSVALTQPMHLQDTKWIRTPYLGYGQILNIGELSGSSAFLDSPGHVSWNNHYSQYLGTAGLEAYNVHGGGPAVARRFADYFAGDGVGQLEHYDGNGDKLIAYDTNFMPGNDADAISFGFPKTGTGQPGSATIERPESAYVWGAFDAAAKLYTQAGADPARTAEMRGEANDIREAILDRLWSSDARSFLARTSYGATSAGSSNGKVNPLPAGARDLIPAKESNMFDIYAENLIPTEDAADYVDGFRFLRYGDNYPIFPFYTANQHDKNEFGIGGSNNFSNINFTVQYRAVRSALRRYDPAGKYITPEYARRLLDWMAWSIYPNGDLRAPNQAEYYSGWNPTTKTYQRNNPNHVMLGNMNYVYVEDMGGIQPRSDDKIELWPIDLGYDHFMVNNLRYHGKDITIVWDRDGSQYGLGAGYSLFIDGVRKASATELSRFTYDPTANSVKGEVGQTVETTSDVGADVPTAVETPIEDGRVVEYLKTAGIDLTEDALNLATTATLTSSFTQQGPRPTPWREFHTPGLSPSSMNYTPGAIRETERPVSLSAVQDGNTVNEPFWGNYGATSRNGYIELDLGGQKSLDNVKVYFMSDRQADGYAEPERWFVQVPDGSGGWRPVTDQFKSPTSPAAKANEALFDKITTDRIRVAFTSRPDRATAITEIQVYESGREVPDATNQAPVVTAERDVSGEGNLRARLVATATDDGAPYDKELAFGWEVVSTPTGGAAVLATPEALTTTVSGTEPGTYVLRFSASDGELDSQADVTVELAETAAAADYGSIATITTSGTSPWENAAMVNDPSTPPSSSSGIGVGWGNFGQQANGSSVERAAFIRYDFGSEVRLSSASIYWYDDRGGIRLPKPDTWVIESSDDGIAWAPVTLTGGSTYGGALQLDGYNKLQFEPISTRNLRIRIFGSADDAPGVGVLRWRTNGEPIDSADSPVIIRTEVDKVPDLPGRLDVVYRSGVRGSLPFTWQEITPAMVSEVRPDPFAVLGTNPVYGTVVEAQIYIRPETPDGGISIQGVQQFAQTVDVGEQPSLPTRLLVSYNDGSRDNRAIGIDWDLDPSVLVRPGTYRIRGDLVLPPYVSRSGTTSTILVLTVVEPDPETDSTNPVISVRGIISGRAYQDSSSVTPAWSATDDRGAASTTATLDGRTFTAGRLDLWKRSLGSHTLVVTAVDRAGNEAVRTLRFRTVTSFGAVRSLLGRFTDVRGASSPQLERALRTHLSRAEVAARAGRGSTAVLELRRFRTAAAGVRYSGHRSVLTRDASDLVRRYL